MDETPGLRRSTRSTRGSLKPIVDLAKVDVQEDDDDQKDEPLPTFKKSDEPPPLSESEDETEKPRRKAKKPAAMAKDKEKTTTKSLTKSKSSSNEKKVSTSRKSRTAAKSLIKLDTDPQTEELAATTEEHETKTKHNESSVYQQDDEEMIYELSEKEYKTVNTAFDTNCVNGEDFLNEKNLKTALRSLGFEPRAEEIQKLMIKFANKQGQVNRDKFQRIMAIKMASSPGINDKTASDEISKVFNLLDLDKTGKITLDNLRDIAKELNEDIPLEELAEMITEADSDGDMQIDKDDFYNIMKKTSLY